MPRIWQVHEITKELSIKRVDRVEVQWRLTRWCGWCSTGTVRPERPWWAPYLDKSQGPQQQAGQAACEPQHQDYTPKSNKTRDKISHGCLFINSQPQGNHLQPLTFQQGFKGVWKEKKRGNTDSLWLASKHFTDVWEGTFGNRGTLIDLQVHLAVLDWFAICNLQD